MVWQIVNMDDYDRDLKRYRKKHARELKAVLDNLETYLQALREGTNPLQIKAGFLHHEPQGVVAIDQKGGGKSLAQTRLYVCADVDTETLYLIALGDKNTQADDIKKCREFASSLAKQKATDDQDKHKTT